MIESKESLELIDFKDSKPINLDNISDDVIKAIRIIGISLRKHIFFVKMIEPVIPMKVKGLTEIFDQKLLSHCIGKYIMNNYEIGKTLEFNLDDIVHQIHALTNEAFARVFKSFPLEKDDNNYPLFLLSQVCDTDTFNSHLVGESVKHLIKIRKKYPTFLANEIHNMLGLNTNLPLNDMEISALYEYLGVKKCIYIHILLNLLFDLKQYMKVLSKELIYFDEIKEIIDSHWFFLLLLTYTIEI